LTTDFITPQYQVGAQYTVWDNGLVQKNFADIVTFTRASTATYFNSAGTLTSAAVNEARFDYNPSTLAPLGLLIEESRTNSIRNNTMVGAVAGTPGTAPTNWSIPSPADGITPQIVGTGTSNGITYIDVKYTGTSGVLGATTLIAFEANAQIAAANAQTWAGTAWVAVVGGSTTNINALVLRQRYNDGAGALLTNTDTSLLTATATMQRFSAVGTASNASTAFTNLGVVANFADSSAIDITLRIGLPQLELGAFATSVIPTTTTALTRSADVASVNTLSPWYNAAEGTLFAEGAYIGLIVARQLAALTDGTTSNLISVQTNPTTATVARGSVIVSGSGQATMNGPAGSVTAGVTAKMAIAYKTDDFAFSVGGSTPATDISGTLPVVDRLQIGSAGTAYSTAYLRRVTYYPRRLANADLQTITT
jgi:hypothetical protein